MLYLTYGIRGVDMKKGFTLIELMAVIVVLGIIALIAIPMIANILKDSQESLFRTSIQNIINKVEETCQMEQINNIELVKEYTNENSILTPQI